VCCACGARRPLPKTGSRKGTRLVSGWLETALQSKWMLGGPFLPGTGGVGVGLQFQLRHRPSEVLSEVMRIEIFLGAGGVLMLGASGCGTYAALTPEAQSVVATTIKPAGNCKSLAALTGKGGGASGGYVSNESLVEYAVNDLRNQAARIGATHVVHSPPTMGGTTSAMVTGEALRCEGVGGTSSAAGALASPAPAVEPGAAPSSPPGGGCDYDTQCKGDRVCVKRECVEPGSSSKLQ
jgi:hypothetical protein